MICLIEGVYAINYEKCTANSQHDTRGVCYATPVHDDVCSICIYIIGLLKSIVLLELHGEFNPENKHLE